MRVVLRLTTFAFLLVLTATAAWGQSLEDRVDRVRRERLGQPVSFEPRRAQPTQTEAAAPQPAGRARASTPQRGAAPQAASTAGRATTQQRMRRIINQVRLDEVTAREAFQWWADQIGAGLVINWQQMQDAGITPDTPITLSLRQAPARAVLQLIMKQATRGTTRLVHETTPWYVEVKPRRIANRDTELRFYDVRDLLMDVPTFSNAPEFDLRSALESRTGGSGGGGSSSSEGIFGDEADEEDDEQATTKRGRAERLADLVANTVEPDIWRRNGGEFASIRYFRGMLLIRAPEYAHRQIGLPMRQPRLGR